MIALDKVLAAARDTSAPAPRFDDRDEVHVGHGLTFRESARLVGGPCLYCERQRAARRLP